MLTQPQVELIQSTWKVVETLPTETVVCCAYAHPHAAHVSHPTRGTLCDQLICLPSCTQGVLLFKHIFEAAPQAAALFSFGKVEGFDVTADHSRNPALVKHAVGVVKTVGVAVGMLKDLEKLVPVLKDLGARHTKYGVLAAHYPIVGAAFLKTLKVGLGDAYTAEVEGAFTEMWGVVESTMLSGTSVSPEASAES